MSKLDADERIVDPDLTPVGYGLGPDLVRPPSRAEVFTPERQIQRPAWSRTRLRRDESAHERVLASAARQVTRSNVVAVVGPQGGPGKTRVAYVLGAALAWHSRLNVVAVDVDDDYGALPDLVADAARSPRSIVDLLAERHGEEAVPFAELRRYLSFTPSGMMILAGPREPSKMRALSPDDLDRLLALLAGVDVVMLDCAAGVTRERAAWAIDRSDQRVVVARPEFTGATTTANALCEAIPTEHTWLVLNKVTARRSELEAIRAVFERTGLEERIEIPHSDTLARSLERATYRLGALPRHVRTPIKMLAACVAETLK